MKAVLTSFAAAALAAGLVACSGKVDPGGPSIPAPSGAAISPAPTPTAGATCTTDIIRPTQAERACQQDSDCVKTYAGGDVCDPCSAPEFFTCQSDAINASSQRSYEASLAQALGHTPTYGFSNEVCGRGSSCPPFADPAICVDGQCTVGNVRLPDGG